MQAVSVLPHRKCNILFHQQPIKEILFMRPGICIVLCIVLWANQLESNFAEKALVVLVETKLKMGQQCSKEG